MRKFVLGKTKIIFVGKYRYDKNKSRLDSISEWRRWEIGLWFRRNKTVGSKNFKNPNKWNDNLVNIYMIGIELLIVKGWIEWSKGAQEIEINI